MPFHTEDPVLTLDDYRMRNIDPRNPENLFGMWSVFARCSGIMENGRRLENMSWRLWNQQTLRLRKKRRSQSSATNSFNSYDSHDHYARSVPELSSSVESVASQDSAVSGINEEVWSSSERTTRNKHITPIGLQSLVVSIKENQEVTRPLSPLHLNASWEDRFGYTSTSDTTSTITISSPRPISPYPSSGQTANTKTSNSTVETATESSISPGGSAETSATSPTDSHEIVRGFKPVIGISSYRSQSQLAPAPIPILKSTNKSTSVRATAVKTGKGMWMLGGSSGEEESSLRLKMSPETHINSSLSNSTRPITSKKTTSFRDEVTEIKSFQISSYDSDEAVSDGEEDESELEEISESAIEDDDDAWEDATEEAREEEKELHFSRVDSSAKLVSRSSMLTAGFHEGDRRAGLLIAASRPGLRRSRTSTPNGPSLATSPTEALTSNPVGQDLYQARPMGMATLNTDATTVLSPKSTRRQMLEHELPGELRVQMLHERHYRNSALPRRHTSADVNKLSTYPEAESTEQSEKSLDARARLGAPPPGGWNHWFDNGLGEFHSKGW